MKFSAIVLAAALATTAHAAALPDEPAGVITRNNAQPEPEPVHEEFENTELDERGLQKTWLYTSCGRQIYGSGNRGCSQAPCRAGGKISWDRAWLASCTIRLYSDSSCGRQVGIASKDWPNHTLSQNIQAFAVKDC